MAERLQTLDGAERCRALVSLVDQVERELPDHTDVGISDEDKLFVLFRMLFQARRGRTFQRPAPGAPSFFGGTTYADWPLEPITLVDGVPFQIVGGYSLGGMPESPGQYLEYCINECRWRSYRFSRKSPRQLRAALSRLLHSRKWKMPLEDWRREFLVSQIR